MQQQNKASAQATSTSLPAVPAPPEWHASELAAPDPCNSAIKRISGRQVYLKDKPQALILLQAAEIQRLTGYLNDYKCKYRALSKEPLDRQSYEIQIKELFQRDSINRIEIERLSKVITTLTASGEQYKKQLLSAQEKYKVVGSERNLMEERNIYLQRQLQTTRQSFDRFIKKSQGEIYSLNSQLASHKTYTESVLKNNNDLVAKVNTIPDYERRIFELQTQMAFYLEQSQRLNKDIEAKTEKLINQQRGYSTLFEKHKNLQSSYEDLKNELASQVKGLEESKLVISQLQGETEKVKSMHDTHMRDSTQVITKRNSDIDALARQVKDYSSKWEADQRSIDTLRRNNAALEDKYALSIQEQVRLSEIIKKNQQKISKYESDFIFLQQQQSKKQSQWQTAIQAQKNDFKLKATELAGSHDQEISKYSEIISKREKQIDELSKANHDLQRALHASKGQLKISQQIIKSQQLQNEKLKKHEQELKQKAAEKQTLTRVVKEKNTTISQLEKTLKQEREKQAELTAKSNKLQDAHEDLKKRFADENISLNKMINNKVTESESLKRQLINNQQELRAQFQSNLEVQNKAHAEKIAKIHEEKHAVHIAHDGLKSENAELKTKHAEVSQVKEQLQKKHGQLSTECKQLQAKIIQLQKTISQNTLKIAELTKDQELLKKYFGEASENNEKLLSQLKAKQEILQTSQNERSKQKQELFMLRGKSIKFNAERSCYDMEIYQLKDQLTKLKKDISKVSEQIAEKESQIAKIKGEREQLSLMLQGKIKESEGLKRKMIELQSELRESFETAFKEKEDSHKNAYKLLSQEKDGLNKKILEIEPHVAIASELQKQKQTLELSLKSASANHEIEKTRSSGLTKQNELLRKAIVDTEAILKSYYQQELALKDKATELQGETLRKEIEQTKKEKDQLKAQRDSLFATTAEYQARITQLIQEIDRLHSVLSNNITQNKTDLDLVRATNSALLSQVALLSEQGQAGQKREEQLTSKYSILSKRVTTYEETLESIRSELVTIQLRTGQLRQERDLLIKKNIILVKSIRALSNELDGLEREGDSIAAFFTKESAIHKELNSRFMNLQDLLSQLQGQKITIIEEKTVEITQVASK